MLRTAVIGIGKMGLSHLSMLRAHPEVDLRAVCDSSGYVLDFLSKYTGLRAFTDVTEMYRQEALDAVVVATPSAAHFDLVRDALERGLHVFCEKPLTLAPAQSRELASLARTKGLCTQVGYHNRFVATFGEVKRLVDLGAIGRVSHVLAEAYGPVVLKEKGGTWRSRRELGGSCLYDYAAHPLDLLSWYCGPVQGVGGSTLGRVFSAATEDQVHATLFYPEGRTAQLSVDWSDESQRKMSTKVTLWGTGGRITADRQECQVYLRDSATPPEGYRAGWNVRYITDLTPPVWFYVRGEEYSAQLDHFVRAALADGAHGPGSEGAPLAADFAAAALTDDAIDMLIRDAGQAVPTSPIGDQAVALAPAASAKRFRRRSVRRRAG